MSNSWRVYLATYLWIEVLYLTIQNAHNFYRVWIYWHSPINHFLDIPIAYTYDIYLECCKDLLCEYWGVDHLVKYRNFRGILSSKMISYNPVQKCYPRDHNIKAVTKVVKSQHSGTVVAVTWKDFDDAKKERRIWKYITLSCVEAEK